MEILTEEALSLAILIIKKSKIEAKLRQTFKCILLKCFSCCGFKSLTDELKYLNEAIEELKNNKNHEIYKNISYV